MADEWHIGALLVFDVLPRQWEDEDIYTLRLFADQAAIALQKANLLEEIYSQGRENARLYEAEQQRTIFLAALQRLGIELATLHDERSVLDTLAVRARNPDGQLRLCRCINRSRRLFRHLICPIRPARRHGTWHAHFTQLPPAAKRVSYR